MSGAILPIYRWQVFYNGSPAAGAKAYFYLSSTSTPHDTYNNIDLDPSHANTNPVVADADGVLPIIYLGPVAYRVTITTSTGTTIFAAQDNVEDLFQVFQATTETANTVYAGPASGSPAAPTFRTLVAADINVGAAMYTAKTTTYAAVAYDLVSATSGTFTVTLPAASSNGNKTIWVVNNGTGVITVGHSGSDTVGLASTQTLNPGATTSLQGDSMTFISDGISNWIIV